MNTFSAILGSLVIATLIAGPSSSQAVEVTAETKRQSFKLDPKKTSFIDFGKFKNKLVSPEAGKTSTKFRDVKFKGKPLKGKKVNAKFDFGIPVPDAASLGHTVSVEMVSLTLISSAPVLLDPFGPGGKGRRGTVTLNLRGAAADPDATVTFADPSSKKKGKFDAKIPKLKKISKKDPSDPTGISKKSKKLSKIDFVSEEAVQFEQNSPISVIAPFCLQAAGVTPSGDPGIGANLCFAPMAAVPASNTVALLGIGLGLLGMVAVTRRRNFALSWRRGADLAQA